MQKLSRLNFALLLLLITSTTAMSDLASACRMDHEPGIDQTLEFRQGGSGNSCLVNGWQDPEGTHVWSKDSIATLDLTAYGRFLTKNSGNHGLKIELSVQSTFPNAELKEIRTSMNNKSCGFLNMKGAGLYTLTLPAIFSDDKFLLDLNIPNAGKSPTDFGIADPRCLGIALSSMRVQSNPTPLPELRVGVQYDMGLDATNAPLAGCAFLRDNWSGIEPNQVWSIGPGSSLMFSRCDARPDTPYILTINVGTFNSGFKLFLNGNELGQGNIGGEYRFGFTIHDLARDANRLDFVVPNPVRPIDIGMNADHRNLGILIKSFRMDAVKIDPKPTPKPSEPKPVEPEPFQPKPKVTTRADIEKYTYNFMFNNPGFSSYAATYIEIRRLTATHLHTLGLAPGASFDEVKRAYRKLAMQTHPDKNKGLDQRFKEIGNAYEALVNLDDNNVFSEFAKK